MNSSKTTSIRLPADLREKLERLAEADQRSLNNMIILLLTRAVKDLEEKQKPE